MWRIKSQKSILVFVISDPTFCHLAWEMHLRKDSSVQPGFGDHVERHSGTSRVVVESEGSSQRCTRPLNTIMEVLRSGPSVSEGNFGMVSGGWFWVTSMWTTDVPQMSCVGPRWLLIAQSSSRGPAAAPDGNSPAGQGAGSLPGQGRGRPAEPPRCWRRALAVGSACAASAACVPLRQVGRQGLQGCCPVLARSLIE